MSRTPRLHVGSDHAGFEAKSAVIAHFRGVGLAVMDHGAFSYDPVDDYPAFCISVASAVIHDVRALGIVLGIVLGGSGNGEQIAANKVDGVRAALAWSIDTARLARKHNDANVLAIGARMHNVAFVIEMAEAFVSEPFGGEARHVRRIRQVAEYEHVRGEEGFTAL